ncbi:MAG: ATPase, T2SS/T4P/T4SS family [Nitrospiraceae bacterium]|nr:ATPase, T2SS/T4P/T4SS family [Nitrospiraceae bacterium]
MSKYAGFFKAVKNEKNGLVEGEAAQPDQGKKPAGFSGCFTVLFVDDEDNVLNALKRIFFEENYNILTAGSGEEALRIMEKNTVHLVVSDHRMPGMQGSELLAEIKGRWPETIRIMLTGYADIQAIMGAVNEGAVYKFITKPWNDDDLRLTVSIALQQYALIQENKSLKELAKQQQMKIKSYANLFDEYRGILGDILVKAKVITGEQLDKALKEKEESEFIGDAIVRLGFTSEAKIVNALSKHQNVDRVDFRETGINPNVSRFLPRELCEKSRLLPIKLDGRHLTIAMADPSDIIKVDNISMLTGLKVSTVVAGSSEILAQIRKVYGEPGEEEGPVSMDESLEFDPIEEIDIVMDDDEGNVNVNELLNSSEVPPIIRIVNAIIMEAVRYNASDIHIEPKNKYTAVRYRIDGMLYLKIRIPTHLHAATISRIKVLSKMDISERRKPQDGRITIKTGTRIVDVRVSTMPTINGEKAVMRILDKGASIRKVDELGMLPGDLKTVEVIIRKPQGMLISTGPTGSGKTTMLYSILYEMLKSTKNFETIEDPVEYFLEDVNQVYVREQIGLSFSSILRATLRQDPDVIMVGEIRDYDTADVAFKAALTGHMVLSTLHTNNTVASITRLIDIGIKPYLIASAMEGVIAQRLVRRVCPHCKSASAPDADIMRLLKIPENALDSAPVGKGCPKCNNTGYLGRIGIFETLLVNDELRHAISGNYRESDVLNLARNAGMKTLMEDGMEKVRLGLTSLEELLRVLGPPARSDRQCGQCGRLIDLKFLFCPFCGTFKHNVCQKCGIPLEEEWSVCPVCGQKRQIPTGGISNE